GLAEQAPGAVVHAAGAGAAGAAGARALHVAHDRLAVVGRALLVRRAEELGRHRAVAGEAGHVARRARARPVRSAARAAGAVDADVAVAGAHAVLVAAV